LSNLASSPYILIGILILVGILLIIGLTILILKLMGISFGNKEPKEKKPKKEKPVKKEKKAKFLRKNKKSDSDNPDDNGDEKKSENRERDKRRISDEDADNMKLTAESLVKKRLKKSQKIKEKKSSQKKPDSRKKKAYKAKKQAKKIKVPKTVQDSIPYFAVYEDDGIIETEKGTFTKSYLLQDINYQIAKQQEQEEMFIKYGEFLNSFDPTIRFQISIIQNNVNMHDFEEKVMLKMKDDNLDELREERNRMLKTKLLEGKNNLKKEKYLTVAVKCNSYEEAQTQFARLDTEINGHINKIGNSTATVVSTVGRLEILHDIYNDVADGEFCNQYVFDENGNPVPAPEKFSFKLMKQLGMTTKDMIGPSSMEFKSDYGKLGDKFFRTLFLRNLPTFLGDDVLSSLTNTDCNMITSILFEPIEGDKGIEMARRQIVNINANVVKEQKKASKSGYSPELIAPQLRDSAEEATNLLRDLTGKNQKLFYTTLVIVHFADTLEQLNLDTDSIMSIGRRLVCDVKKLSWQQENGLNTALPLATNKLSIKRSLTTESAAVFMPFVNQELNDPKGGMYYGNNAISHNLIMLNRRNLKNGNGFIFGTPGSGKSMSAKQEMLTVLLSSDDVVIVIDPEGEYYPMAALLGGEVIRIAPGGNVHINPFDIDMNYDSDDDPMSIKSDFIASICETVAGDRFGLSPGQRSIIDRCVRKVYEPFFASFNEETKEYDKSKLPTLKDFYDLLRVQSGYEAMNLADGLEMYVDGSLNIFAHHTNVEYSKRFVVYDIKDIGQNMKAMGLQVVLDNVWNRIVAGRSEGRNTWFFIDEIYLLFKSQASAEFLRQLYKRARKYGGIPTGITQNVSDLLENDIARTMISNCEYILMLNQAPLDRVQLGEMLNMSSTEMEHITNANPGEGLIYNGSVKVPFINQLPKDSKAYQAMTTRLSEVAERDKNQALSAGT